jgi:hypothetical protein
MLAFLPDYVAFRRGLRCSARRRETATRGERGILGALQCLCNSAAVLPGYSSRLCSF